VEIFNRQQIFHLVFQKMIITTIQRHHFACICFHHLSKLYPRLSSDANFEDKTQSFACQNRRSNTKNIMTPITSIIIIIIIIIISKKLKEQHTKRFLREKSLNVRSKNYWHKLVDKDSL